MDKAPGFRPWDCFLVTIVGVTQCQKFFFVLARAWANTLGIKNAKVMRISGFKKVDEYEIVDGQEVRPEVDKKETTETNINHQ